jgi:hypothetical protein
MPRLLVPLLILIAVAATASCTSPETEAAAETAIRDILSEDVRKARSLASATAESQIASFEQNYAKGYSRWRRLARSIRSTTSCGQSEPKGRTVEYSIPWKWAMRTCGSTETLLLPRTS